MKVLRGDGPVLRIGHRGAAALAPENTLPSLRAAVETGVDLVEFDVVRGRDHALVLSHDPHHLPEGGPTLDDALGYLAGAGVGAHVDLKESGYEAEIAEALRRHAMVERSVVTSLNWASLRDVRRHEPRATIGISYPEDRYGVARRPALAPLVRGGVLALRRILPRLVVRWLAHSGASAAVLHHELVTRAVVRSCHSRGAAVWAWTVNDAGTAARLADWDADAIITDDPRILRGRST
jgi:glycerophosphoryl diester phosphodiesterase